MARLLAFVACEKVLQSDEQSTSLISILQGYNLPIAPPPDDTVMLPITVSTYALWEREANDKLGDLSQKVQLVTDNTVLLDSKEGPVIADDSPKIRFHRFTFILQGLPIRGARDHSFKLLVRSPNTDFVEKASFTVPIIYAPPTP